MSRVCPHRQIHVALRQRGWSGRTREKTRCGFLGIPQVDRFDDLYVIRRVSVQGCVFWGLVHAAPHFGGKIPFKPLFCGREQAVSSLTCQILKFAYYRNYCANYNQILHSHKDHQILFVGGPNKRTTNPRWRTAAILKNLKSSHVSGTVWPIFTKFGTVTRIDPPNRTGSQNSQLLKSKMANGRHFEKWKIGSRTISINGKACLCQQCHTPSRQKQNYMLLYLLYLFHLIKPQKL